MGKQPCEPLIRIGRLQKLANRSLTLSELLVHLFGLRISSAYLHTYISVGIIAQPSRFHCCPKEVLTAGTYPPGSALHLSVVRHSNKEVRQLAMLFGTLPSAKMRSRPSRRS